MNANATGRTRRLQIMMEDHELELIDSWRFENNMPTRAAAVRELIRRGLSADGGQAPLGAKSTDFTITAVDKARAAPKR